LRLLLFSDRLGGSRLFLCCCLWRSWRLGDGWFDSRRGRRFSLRAQAHLHKDFIKRPTFTLRPGGGATTYQGFRKLPSPTIGGWCRFRCGSRSRRGSRRFSPGPTGHERVDIDTLRVSAGSGSSLEEVGGNAGVGR
jgi:hypothetical protein